MNYCDKFVRHPNYIEDIQTGIRYINRKDLEGDASCEKVCDKIALGTCIILNHFDKIERPILKNLPKELYKFGDEKKNHKRKV